MRRATLDASLRLARADVSDFEIEELRAEISFCNPARAAALRRGSRGARFLDARLSPIVVTDDEIIVPREARRVVEFVLGRLDVVDRQVDGEPLGATFRGELRDYQAKAVEALRAAGGGVVVAPTGSGKSEIGLAAIAALDRTALVLVHALDLATQWRERARERLGVEAGMCVAGAVDVRPFTIATIQTLLGAGRLAEMARRFGTVLVDEAHHVPARTFTGVLDHLPARHRIGVTATPRRTDGLEVLLEWSIGPTVATVDTSELADAGHVVRPLYRPVRSAFVSPYAGPSDWAPLLERLVADGPRSELVAALAAGHWAKERDPVLVLTGRVAHATELAARARSLGAPAEVMTGVTPARERRRVLADVRAGRLGVLVATSLADEGLDLPALGAVVLAWPARAEGRFLQRIGRVVRPSPGKGAPVVFDVVDARVGVLARQARIRAEAFRRAWGEKLPRVA